MHYYNGLGAAERIGISYKTLLRWIEKGKIRPEEGKTPTGQLIISGDQVERLRLETQRERDTFRQPHTASHDSHEQTEIDTDMERRIASMAQSIANLNATVASQTRRIDELTKRMTDLEAKSTPIIAEQVHRQPQTVQPLQNTTPKQSPQIRPTIAEDIPGDWTLCFDFFKQHGISETSWRRWMKGSLAGDRFEHERRGKYSYFDPSQQEHALELLRKHHKFV